MSYRSQSRVTASLPVPPLRAFRMLEDPASFQQMIAGARKIRRFDSRWPEPGTRLDHTVGIPPFLLRDHTEVVEQEPPRLLVLDALVRPLGRLRVEFRFEEEPGGTRLTVTERPEDGPMSWPVLRTVTMFGLQVRNREICRRFRKLTERRRRAEGD